MPVPRQASRDMLEVQERARLILHGTADSMLNGCVAQRIERLASDQKVGGSRPYAPNRKR